ncbi:MPT63 family protein [Mycolicibacterium palauense]|uniref:MPT63 family protein n=1 Tax=Mycolicibacterium palauense TaxID=2034511 RepID=UPI000BFEF9F2|nr:MPT63 family protein [Mycolicibacterium palauense]
MRNRNLVAASAAVVCLGLVGAPSAAADDAVVHTFGQPAELVNGDVVQAWTVTNLKPSADVIPYRVAGTLWEATATDTAVRGTVQPIVSNLNARARSGQTYRVLFGVATPQGVNPAALAQGEQTSGKVYFDVVGPAPETVVYNSMGTDLAQWVAPPPAPAVGSPTGSGQWSPPAGTQAAPSVSAGAGGEDAAETPLLGAEGAAVADELPTGSQGTPVAATPEPVAEGSQGTPLPTTAGSQGTPLPASEGSQGTALGEATVPAAPTQQPAAAPAESPGTPTTAVPATTAIEPTAS